MEHETHVSTVKLLNRHDCCSNRIDGHEVWVGEHKCGTLFSSMANSKGWIKIKCPYSAIGNEVTIKKPVSYFSPLAKGKADYLTVCGFKITGWGK